MQLPHSQPHPCFVVVSGCFKWGGGGGGDKFHARVLYEYDVILKCCHSRKSEWADYAFVQA